MSFEIILAGFSLGMLVGLTGMGGGSLVTPIMIFVFGLWPMIAVGTAVAITSVGSGSLFVPFMLEVYPMPVSRVIGIDVFHWAVLTAVAVAGHLANGSVDFHLLLNLLLGSVPGVVAGSRMSLWLPRRVTEVILGILLVISGFRLL